MDINKIRSDFPLLSNSPEIVYFDNSCMTLRPRQVISAITDYYEKMSACAGRSNHRLAALVSEAVEESRRKIQKFVQAKSSEEIIFTRNTSEGFNLVANSLEWLPEDLVLISDKEHNSNLVPWLKLRDEKGIKVQVIKSLENNETDLHAWQKAMELKPRLVSIVMTSNLADVFHSHPSTNYACIIL